MITFPWNYVPNEGQARFHRSSAPFKCGLAGVGGGKTTALCVEGLLLAMANPKTEGMIVAPTWDMVEQTTIPALRKCLPPGTRGSGPMVHRWADRGRTLVLRNGSRIRFRPAFEPDHLRGPNLAWFGMDEAALCPAAAWEVLLGRVRVRDARRCAAMVVTTPRGYDWIWKCFAGPDVNRNPATGRRELIRWPTAANAANLREGFEAELRGAYDVRHARQELEASFEQCSGLVYPDVIRSPWPGGSLMRHDPDPRLPTDIGIDLGFRRPAAVWIQRSSAGPWVIVDEELPENCPVDRFAARILARPWRVGRVFADAAGAARHGVGDTDIGHLRRAGLPVRVTTDPQKRRVLAGVRVLQGMFLSAQGRRTLTLATDAAGICLVPGVQSALENYAWPAGPPDSPAAEEPRKDGINDHAADALRYWAIGTAGQDAGPRIEGRAWSR